MQLRRSLATTAVILAATAALSSCGMDYATDREFTPAAGTNDRSATIDVMSTVVVSGAEGSGTLILSLSNNDIEAAHSLTAVSGTTLASEGVQPSAIAPADFEPVEVPADGLVNLADSDAPIALTGEFEAGDFVNLTFEFDNGESATFNVPVVDNVSSVWAGLDATYTGPPPAEETAEAETEESSESH